VTSISAPLQESIFWSEEIIGATVQAAGTLDGTGPIALEGGNVKFTGSATCTGDVSDGSGNFLSPSMGPSVRTRSPFLCRFSGPN